LGTETALNDAREKRMVWTGTGLASEVFLDKYEKRGYWIDPQLRDHMVEEGEETK
jgi:hypothetical protein